MTGAPRFRVRPATRDDLDAVLEIEAASFSTPWSRRTFEALLDRPTVHFRVLEAPAPGEAEGVEARASGEAVGEPAGGPAGEAPGESTCPRVRGHGILWWSGPEAEVANVAVHPDLRPLPKSKAARLTKFQQGYQQALAEVAGLSTLANVQKWVEDNRVEVEA